MKKYKLLLLISFVTLSLFSQEKVRDYSDALYYSSKLDSVKLKATLSILASDEFEGRGTAESGGTKTEKYLADYLKSIGISSGNNGSYFQNIGMHFREGKNKEFTLNDSIFYDYFDYSNKVADTPLIEDDEILFVGYGFHSPTYDDFSNVDISNKTILMFDGMPTDRYGVPYGIDSTQKYLPGTYISDYIIEKKPKAIIRYRAGANRLSGQFRSNQKLIPSEGFIYANDIPSIMVNELLANKLLESTGKTVKQIMYEIERDGTPQTAILPASFSIKGEYKYENANVNNVIGFIEGTDLKDEFVIVSAHHDHVGIIDSLIFNGADDNASGTSSLLEIARIMEQAKKEGKAPRRSIIFLLPAAEELGLYGSRYYTSNPVYPLDSVVANINLDMLGRTSYQRMSQSNNYVYIVNDKSKSGNLIEWIEPINSSTTQLDLDYEFTSPDDLRMLFNYSDNHSFAQKGIPSISFSSGEHKDYHKPTDNEEFIDYDGLLKRTRLAFLVIWKLANSDNKPIKKDIKTFNYQY